MDLHILFEDNHFLVVKKDFLTQLFDIDKQVEQYLEKKQGKIGFLKRLFDMDKLVSGILVYVKTSKAFDRLTSQEPTFKFLSVCVGRPKQNDGYFSANVQQQKNGKLELAPKIKDSFETSFYYKHLQTVSKISLIETSISSPNSDAVRFGLSSLSLAVFGDKLYGGDSLAKNTNLALLLFEVCFEHPTTHQKMIFRCSPIEDAKPWSYFDLNKIYKI